MAVLYKNPRGTLANLVSLAGAAGLIPYQLYFVTDEARLYMALTTTTYTPVGKKVEPVAAITSGTLRDLSQLQITGNDVTGLTGSGLELQGGATGQLQAYNRTGSAYITLNVGGSIVNLQSGGSTRVSVQSTAVVLSSCALNEAAEVSLASAATLNLGSRSSNSILITGTTTVTGADVATAGIRRKVRFAGILVLTHNGTSFDLFTSANITTAAGDTAEFLSLGSGNWVMTAYQRKSGAALV
jgi:hypothetical protein